MAALAHLDTQWQWTVRDTAARFLPRTVLANEALFERFPRYVLNFEGAHRYRLLADCHPELLAVVRRRVEEGRWFPAGAAWEAFDSNLPSPESLIRQILLGTREFERLVGRAGRDLLLPDCFGFSRALPSVAVHCGIVGFSTQKLRRGPLMRSAFGIPFPIGRWVGPDGAELLSALDPGEYGAQTRTDLAHDADWTRRLAAQRSAGLPEALLTYQGLGDQGGAIAARTAAELEKAASSNGALEVRIATSEQIFLDLAAERSRLPSYEGELLLGLHATGCYTSRAQLKAWHAAAEALAEAAERAVALASPFLDAESLRASSARLRRAWERILSHQMHDDLTGTSLPAAYRWSAADLALSMNELEQELAFAAERAGEHLAASAEGEALLLFNPLGGEREEVVEVELPDSGAARRAPRICTLDGEELPAQWTRHDSAWRGAVLARAPGLSFSGLTLREAREAERTSPETPASPGRELENGRYRALLDERGDLCSLLDREQGIELLSGPVRFELLDNRSERFPSWEIRYEDCHRAPRAYLEAPCEPVWVERGPLRSTCEVVQLAAGSRFQRRYSLAAGGQLEVEVGIDWRTDGTLLKASFPFAWEFSEALFDLGIGVARRGVATATLYEVPAQQWAAAPRPGGGGAAVLSDCKQGWDHPDKRRLRLTLLHTPSLGRRFTYQRRQDFGAHRFRFAIAGYTGEDALATLAAMGARFRQPLRLFAVSRPAAVAERAAWAPISLRDPAVLLQALKPAEDGDGVILRLRELSGAARPLALELSPPFRRAAAVDGCERPLTPPSPDRPVPALGAFALMSQRLTVSRQPARDAAIPDSAMPYARTLFVVGERGSRAVDGGLDGHGFRLPRHLLPPKIRSAGIDFDLSPLHRAGAATAARAEGQRLATPRGMRRLALLLAAFAGPVEATFRTSSRELRAIVRDGFAPLGRFDELHRRVPLLGALRVRAGFLDRAAVRLEIPHRLDPAGRIDACRPVLLFGIDLALDPTGDWVELPLQPKVLLFAASVSPSPAPGMNELTAKFLHPTCSPADAVGG